jgi:hypothetical protein
VKKNVEFDNSVNPAQNRGRPFLCTEARMTSVCRKTKRYKLVALALLIIGLSWSPFVLAQADGKQQEAETTSGADAVEQSAGGELSADAAAKALANPVGSLADLANNLTYRTFNGNLPDADSQTALTYTFQPVLLFSAGDKGRNIIVPPA